MNLIVIYDLIFDFRSYITTDILVNSDNYFFFLFFNFLLHFFYIFIINIYVSTLLSHNLLLLHSFHLLLHFLFLNRLRLWHRFVLLTLSFHFLYFLLFISYFLNNLFKSIFFKEHLFLFYWLNKGLYIGLSLFLIK